MTSDGWKDARLYSDAISKPIGGQPLLRGDHNACCCRDEDFSASTGTGRSECERLFLCTLRCASTPSSQRHVMSDEPSKHFPRPHPGRVSWRPDKHCPLGPSFRYRVTANRKSLWQHVRDGWVTSTWPDRTGPLRDACLHGLSRLHAPPPPSVPARHIIWIAALAAGIGFPLGFHDNRDHLPVARQAGVASLCQRFQGEDISSPDARTSTAPARRASGCDASTDPALCAGGADLCLSPAWDPLVSARLDMLSATRAGGRSAGGGDERGARCWFSCGAFSLYLSCLGGRCGSGCVVVSWVADTAAPRREAR